MHACAFRFVKRIEDVIFVALLCGPVLGYAVPFFCVQEQRLLAKLDVVVQTCCGLLQDVCWLRDPFVHFRAVK